MQTPNGVRAIEAIDPELRQRLAAHDTKHMIQQRYSMAGELVFSTDKGDRAAPVLKYGEIWHLGWHVLQRELAEALPQGVLHPRHRFVRYSETADGVSVQFEGPEGPASVEAAVVVGCDGSQSLVREQLLGDGPPKYLGEVLRCAVLCCAAALMPGRALPCPDMHGRPPDRSCQPLTCCPRLSLPRSRHGHLARRAAAAG